MPALRSASAAMPSMPAPSVASTLGFCTALAMRAVPCTAGLKNRNQALSVGVMVPRRLKLTVMFLEMCAASASVMPDWRAVLKAARRTAFSMPAFIASIRCIALGPNLRGSIALRSASAIRRCSSSVCASSVRNSKKPVLPPVCRYSV